MSGTDWMNLELAALDNIILTTFTCCCMVCFGAGQDLSCCTHPMLLSHECSGNQDTTEMTRSKQLCIAADLEMTNAIVHHAWVHAQNSLVSKLPSQACAL